MRVACRTRWRRPLVRRDLCLFPGDPGDPSEVEDSRPSSLAEKETLFADSGSSNSLSGVGELTAGGAAGSDVEIARVFAELGSPLRSDAGRFILVWGEYP